MKKIMCSIIAGIAVSTISVFAAEEAQTEKTLLERIEALEAGAKKSDWSEKIKIKGDLRYRYEYIGVENEKDVNRQRIRARLGAYADVNDFTTAGLRIATRQDANSGNETIGDEFEGKDVFLDLAYMTLAPQDGKYGAATLGKMKYPWKVVTDLIWDSDVNPEGIAYTYSTQVDETGIFGSVGYFKVDDDSSTEDFDLVSAQAGIVQPLGEKSKLTAGGSLFAYNNAIVFGAPVDYEIVQLFGEVSFKDVLPVAFKLYGDYVNNTEENNDNQGYCAGIKFGDAKKGKWEAKVGYRRLEEFAAFDPFADSDFAGGGTDVEGARLKAAYNIGKHLQAGLTYIDGERITSGTDVNTLHLDLIASF